MRTSDRCHWCGNPPVVRRPSYNACHCEPARTLVWQSVSPGSANCQALALIRLALAGDARATYTLWSNCHWKLLDFDSLRGAPPQRGRLGVRIVTRGNPWKGPHQSAVRNLILDFLKRTGVHRTVFPRLRLGRPFESRLFVNKKRPRMGAGFITFAFPPTVLRTAFGKAGILPRAKNCPPDSFSPGYAWVALSNPASSLTKKRPRTGALFCWRREWDSNPRWVAPSPVFKTGSLNHSDISPDTEKPPKRR